MEATFEGSVKNLVEDKGLKWVFVGGKGGVGKTTTSSSLAVLLSQTRRDVLIVSTDPAHNLSDAFDQKFTAKPTLVNGFTNLYGMEVDPKVDADKITLPHIAGLIEDEQATKTFLSEIVSAVPGIDEAMTFSELISSIEKENFDLVVFDTAPTGHTLRLLNFPNVMEKGLEKLVSLKQKFQGIFQQFSGLLGGNNGDMFDKVFGNMEQLKDIAVKVNEQMKDANRTTFVAVCIPEFLSMYETDRLIQELAKYNIDIHNIVINQVLFPNDECNMCIARHKMQKKYLEQILEMYEDFHITIMPLQEEEVRGNEKLKNFGKLLCQPKAKPELPQKK